VIERIWRKWWSPPLLLKLSVKFLNYILGLKSQSPASFWVANLLCPGLLLLRNCHFHQYHFFCLYFYLIESDLSYQKLSHRTGSRVSGKRQGLGRSSFRPLHPDPLPRIEPCGPRSLRPPRPYPEAPGDDSPRPQSPGGSWPRGYDGSAAGDRPRPLPAWPGCVPPASGCRMPCWDLQLSGWQPRI
jgi:hypothetical protein